MFSCFICKTAVRINIAMKTRGGCIAWSWRSFDTRRVVWSWWPPPPSWQRKHDACVAHAKTGVRNERQAPEAQDLEPKRLRITFAFGTTHRETIFDTCFTSSFRILDTCRATFIVIRKLGWAAVRFTIEITINRFVVRHPSRRVVVVVVGHM